MISLWSPALLIGAVLGLFVWFSSPRASYNNEDLLTHLMQDSNIPKPTRKVREKANGAYDSDIKSKEAALEESEEPPMENGEIDQP